jgi:hypothetical protein
MATGTRALTLKLLADVDNFTKNLNKADNDVMSFGDKVSDFGKKAGLAFAAAGAAAVAYAGKLAIDGVKSAIADAAAQATLAKTLVNVTGATKDQVKATEDYILSTSLANGVTDEELRPSLDRLVRSTKNVEEAQKLQNLALNVAAGTGKNLGAVSEALAKAYDGNFGALKKLGVPLDENIIKTKDFDKAQQELAATFEGQAATKAETFAGKLDRLQIAFDEGKETLGGFILNAITPFVETVVNKVIPAIASFVDNLSENLSPIMKTIQPVINGVRNAFNSVKNSLVENNDELQPFYNFMKAIYNFAKDYLAPILGKTLGAAFTALGKIIAGVIDTFAGFVSQLTNIYNRIKGIIDFIRGAAGAVADFFGASSTSSTSSVPKVSSVTVPKVTQASSQTNITVNGAIDPEGTARTIVSVLNNSAARGTLGAAGLVY